MSNIPQNVANGTEQFALKVSSGITYWFVSAWFAFMLTYGTFMKSPFFLFLTYENFFIFYIIMGVLTILVKYGFGSLVGFVKKYMG